MALLGLLASCVEMRFGTQPPAPLACERALTTYGSRTAISADPEGVAMGLREVPLTPTTIGYGPGGSNGAELTLVDGVWQISRATGPDALLSIQLRGMMGSSQTVMLTAHSEAPCTPPTPQCLL